MAGRAATKTLGDHPLLRPKAVQFRVEKRLAEEAASTLRDMGLSVPDAVRLFLRAVVADRALPSGMRVPSDKSVRAMRQALAPDLATFRTAEELFDDLEKGGVR